jgi:hypothetical protein
MNWVNLELFYSLLAETDGVATLISPPGEGNTTGTGGRPRNIHSGALDKSVCVCNVIKLY